MTPVGNKAGASRRPNAGCLLAVGIAVGEAWAIACAVATGFNTTFGDGSQRTTLAALYGVLCVALLIPAGWGALLWDGWKARALSMMAILGLAAVGARAAGAAGMEPVTLLLLGMPAWLLLVGLLATFSQAPGMRSRRTDAR